MRYLPSFLLLFVAVLLGSPQVVKAQSAASQPTASDHNSLHEENRIRAQATEQARWLCRALHLNDAQLMQIRDFAFMHLHQQNADEARFAQQPDERRAHLEEAAARFQRNVVNVLTDSQVETYFQLLARQARRDQAKEKAKEPVVVAEPTAPAPTAQPASLVAPKPRRR